MTAKGQNFEMFQGDTTTITISVLDTAGSAVNISGYAASWVMYVPTTHETILEKTTVSGGGITIADPSTGVITIALLPVDTENITPRLYNHECEITLDTDNVYTVAVGTVAMLYGKI
jgi:hypothetical protein